MTERYRPGERVHVSGQYAVVDDMGIVTEHEITATRGEHFPPTEGKGYTFQLVDPTQHSNPDDAHGDEPGGED